MAKAGEGMWTANAAREIEKAIRTLIMILAEQTIFLYTPIILLLITSH
jgi:hypothetical protein